MADQVEARQQYHLSEWMRLKEETNKDLVKIGRHLDERLKALEARLYDLEHSHTYIIQELRALIGVKPE